MKSLSFLTEVIYMGKKKAVENQFHNALKEKISFGQSKRKDKANMRFGESTYKIYSYSTYNTYLKVAKEYAKWLKEIKQINKYEHMENTEQFATEYLKYRQDNNISVYTLKMERSALSMLYNRKIDYELPKRDNKAITRSRNETSNDKHYSREGKYKDVFALALATGGRRKDLKNLRANALREINGNLYVVFKRSKGGRDRLSPVRSEYAQQVREIFLKRQIEGKERVLDKIPKKIDIHALRREYAQSLYREIVSNRTLRDEYLKQYPPRRELKTQKGKDGRVYTKEIKTSTYKDRESNIFNRNDLYVISQSLGHNRLDVSLLYLK